MTPLSQKDWPAFRVPACECGHTEGDHKSGKQAVFARSYGVCLRRGCECRAFRDVQMESARMDPRGLGDGLGRA